MKRKSILWTIDKEELFKIADSCLSINKMLQYFNLSGSAFYTLKSRLIDEGYDLNKFANKIKLNREKHKWELKPLQECLVENSEYSRSCLKRRIIQNNLIPYVCDLCLCDPIWNGKELVLILDHINGVRNDNRIENLRFICPNCNSQTETFAGRNKHQNHKVCSCGKKIYLQSNDCKECSSKKMRKVDWPTFEQLKELLENKNYVQIAKDFNVSDKTVAKWAKFYGLK